MFSRRIFILFNILCLYVSITIADLTRLEFCEHVTQYGVTCKTYKIVTEDGYVLGVQRIGNGLPKEDNAAPVLMWHGAICSSDSLVIMGNVSTPVQLALAGYDVWMGNSRGNIYSRKHTTLDPDLDKTKFWDFTFHEMALYDLPAVIDYILMTTGQQKLSAIGHSQGTTIFFALGSLRPEYNEKIQIFIAMAPVAYMPPANYDEHKSPSVYATALKAIGSLELLSSTSVENYSFQFLCSQGLIGYMTCMTVISQMGGPYVDDEMPLDIFEQFLIYYFGGASIKTWNHFIQISESGRFAYFDYGDAKNFEKYGSYSPPLYDLKKVTMPVAMICGPTDKMATLENIDRLRSQLPNVVSHVVINDPKYGHYGFMASKSMPYIVNPLIDSLLRQYDNIYLYI